MWVGLRLVRFFTVHSQRQKYDGALISERGVCYIALRQLNTLLLEMLSNFILLANWCTSELSLKKNNIKIYINIYIKIYIKAAPTCFGVTVTP